MNWNEPVILPFNQLQPLGLAVVAPHFICANAGRFSDHPPVLNLLRSRTKASSSFSINVSYHSRALIESSVREYDDKVDGEERLPQNRCARHCICEMRRRPHLDLLVCAADRLLLSKYHAPASQKQRIGPRPKPERTLVFRSP